MTKVKVIEVDATKLDPNATYIIVFNNLQMPRENMNYVVRQLDDLGIKAAYMEATDPKNALQVYQIPKAEAGQLKEIES